MTYILDACSLVALFKKENGADKVKALLEEARTGQHDVFMNIINLIEMNYLFHRALGKEKSAALLEQISLLPIQFISTIDEVIFSEASRIKAQYAVPLGDAIGLATVIRLGGTFVTSDHDDLEKIEKAEPLSFFWFR